MTSHPVVRRIALVASGLVLVGAGVAVLTLAATSRPTSVRIATSSKPPLVVSVTGTSSLLRTDGTPVGTPASTRPTDRIDPAWLARTSRTTRIPARALLAYAGAQLTITAEEPGCGIGWNTLAGIGRIESDHGRHSGAVLGEDGYSAPAIRGIPLDGSRSARIADTDRGRWDGDTRWDRAVGPLQFIPSTWERWGADGNGDGIADPNQIDDAALAAARYLCAAGPMTTPAGWRTAIFSYSHLDSYVDDVAAAANLYAEDAAH